MWRFGEWWEWVGMSWNCVWMLWWGWRARHAGGNSIHVLLMKLNTEELNSRSGSSSGQQIKSGDGGNAKQCIPMQQALALAKKSGNGSIQKSMCKLIADILADGRRGVLNTNRGRIKDSKKMQGLLSIISQCNLAKWREQQRSGWNVTLHCKRHTAYHTPYLLHTTHLTIHTTHCRIGCSVLGPVLTVTVLDRIPGTEGWGSEGGAVTRRQRSAAVAILVNPLPSLSIFCHLCQRCDSLT